jgi:hypothetical protein
MCGHLLHGNREILYLAFDAKELIGIFSKEREVQLGAFLVPWRKSEHGGSYCFILDSSKSQLATKSLTDLTDGGKLWVTLTG